VDSKAKYSALSNTAEKNIKKKHLKQTHAQCMFKICEGSPEGTKKTMEERICERDEF